MAVSHEIQNRPLRSHILSQVSTWIKGAKTVRRQPSASETETRYGPVTRGLPAPKPPDQPKCNCILLLAENAGSMRKEERPVREVVSELSAHFEPINELIGRRQGSVFQGLRRAAKSDRRGPRDTQTGPPARRKELVSELEIILAADCFSEHVQRGTVITPTQFLT